MLPKHLSAALAGGLLLAFGSAETASAAARITWQSSRGSAANPITNLQSDGAELDASFQFELGAFKDLPDGSPFNPTAANVAEWEAQWCAASTPAPYNISPNSFFTGSFQLESNAAPFEVGDPAFIWGFDIRAGRGEWILLRRDSWVWPTVAGGGGINPVTTFFTVSATFNDLETIVGEVNGTGFLMQTEEVNLSSGTTYAEWVATNFTAAEQADLEISGETADPDRDGSSNLFEFATGTAPKDAGSFPECTINITAAGEVQITFPENPDALVAWSLEASSDLDSWAETTPPVPGTPNTADGTRSFTDPVPISASERRFLRLAVSSL